MYKILIVKLSSIGDVVHALPYLPILRKYFPESYIAWVVEKKAKEILEGNKYIDELIIIDTKKWRKELLTKTNLLNTIKEIKEIFFKLNKKRFDIALDIQGLSKSGVITFLSNAKIRIGFSPHNCREIINVIFTNYKAKTKNIDAHIVDKNLSHLELFGIIPEKEKKEFFISIPAECQARSIRFFEDKIQNNNMLIGINPGAAWESKLWGIDKYAKLSDMLVEYYSAKILLLWGNSKEEAFAWNIYNIMKNKPIISYKSSIKDFCAIVKHCQLIIGPDTGPIHISDALGVKTVMLFGPSSPSRNRTYNGNRTYITGRCENLGCYKRICNPLHCMNTITVEEVFEKIIDTNKSAKDLPL